MSGTRDDQPSRPARSGRLGSVLLWCERVLLVTGAVCVVAWVSACAQRTVVQEREETRFEDRLREALGEALVEEQHDQRDWSPKRIDAYQESLEQPAEAIARLTIESVGISVMVLDGNEESVLDRAVGRIPGTAAIGEVGNLGIAGHRDGFFRPLRHIEHGAEIQLATLEGVARYRVHDILIVDPEDVEVLERTVAPSLTLVTCYPFYYVGSAPRRYIVQAEQVGFDPWTQETAATYLGEGATRW